MNEINNQILNLGSIEKTLIIPLWARAEESIHGGLIKDELSEKIISKIDISIYGFDQMSKFVRNYLLTAIANRTILIDKYLDKSITKQSVVYNFGCGLDTRFARYEGRIRKWFDIDMADVIDLRKNFFKESENYKMISGSILDPLISQIIESPGNSIVICEGLLMYFKESEVQSFLTQILNRSKGGNMILETLGSWAKIKVNPVIKGIGENSRYTWTLNNTMDCRKLDNRMMMISSNSIFDINYERWGAMGMIMKSSYLNKRVSSKITLYGF